MEKHRVPTVPVKKRYILVLASAVSAVLTLIAILPSTQSRAQSEHAPCVPPLYAASQVFELVPRIPQLAPSDLAVGIFVTHTFSIYLEGGEMVCLASSPDGSGALSVDDQIDLQFVRADGSKLYWKYNFSDPLTGGIVSGPSQDISTLFGPGRNDVLIFLADLTPKYHSAEPIWLVIWQHVTRLTVVPAVISTLVGSSTPAPIPSIKNTSTAAPSSHFLNPTTAVSPVRTPSATSPPPRPPETAGTQINWSIPFAIAIALALVLCLRFGPVRLGHLVARLFLRITQVWRIWKIKSAPDPNVALREFDRAFGEIMNARGMLSDTTVSSIREYFEALYESVTKTERG